MNKGYRSDKEYTITEILRYNMKKWWLAAIFAIAFAVILGGYKFISLREYVDNDVYQDKQEVRATLFIHNYNSGSVAERANNIMKISQSNSTYEKFCEYTGIELTLDEYRNSFTSEQTEAADVVTFYIGFPHSVGEFSLNEEEVALVFMDGLLKAIQDTSKTLTGEECATVLDTPYVSKEVEKMVSYTITQDDYQMAVMKGLTAGVLLGLIIEVVLYTIWLLLYKKPKNVAEVQECLDAQIIDVLKSAVENVERYKKVALYLKGSKDCNKISCLSIRNFINDVPLKIAMCYANEQKKTLYIDLNDSDEEKHSISGYIIGKQIEVKPEKLNDYLDILRRHTETENGLDLAGNDKFKTLLEKMSKNYEYIIISSGDALKSAEGYNVSALCDKTFAVCTRKNVTTEMLYEVRNTVENNGIRMDGVLVYDL